MNIKNIMLNSIYFMVQRIRKIPRYKNSLGAAIYKYVDSLPRLGRALFWKIWNLYDITFSEKWYAESKKHRNITLYSLLCYAPHHTATYKQQCAELDYVMAFKPTLGLSCRRG
jgi:hypothetical protein